MLNKYAIISAISVFYSNAAIAEAFNYSKLNIGYSSSSSRAHDLNDDIDGNHLTRSLSVGVTDDVALQLGYAKRSSTFVSNNGVAIEVDVTTNTIAASYHTSIHQNTDVVFFSGYLKEYSNIMRKGRSVVRKDADGYAFGAGVRSMMFDNVELNIVFIQSYIGGVSGGNLTLGGEYYLQPGLSLSASFSNADGGSFSELSVSKYF